MKPIQTFARSLMIILTFFAFTSQAFAMKAPDQVVRETVDSMVSKLYTNRTLYKSDNQALYQMLEDTLVPALNVPRMADLVLGKEVARSASKGQKDAFVKEFKHFLLQSYGTGLLSATGQEKVIYQPLNIKPGADKVKVKAALVASDGSEYPIILSMSNRGDDRWRAYNMEVVGINFIRTFRASFAATLQKKGIDGLIADLRAKNAG